MEPLRIFERFNLEQLDANWIKNVWDKDFIVYDTIPSDYLLFAESDDMEYLLKDTSATIKDWIALNKNQDPNEPPEVSWQTLCALNIDSRALLALLGSIIKTGQRLNADEDSRQACLQATSLYLTLLALPGSSAYQIFHENLYATVINSLQLSEHLVPIIKKPIKSMDLESLYINDEEPSSSLLQTEKITLTKGLNIIMYDMILMLNSWCMRDHVRSLELTVHSLIEVTKLGGDNHDFKSQKRNSEANIASLAHNAYAALAALCHTRHGPLDVTIKLISKYFLPHLLLSYTNMPTRCLNIVRETTINFLKTLLNTHGRNADMGVMILIQKMMINCPERLEGRQKQAAVLVKLINITEDALHAKVIKDLVLFSHHTKISCRIFAQEIIGRILLGFNNEDFAIAEQKQMIKVLFAVVLSRCSDNSSMVRGRAMATLAEYSDNNTNPVVQEIFTCSNEQKGLASLEELKIALVEDNNILPDSKCVIAMLKLRMDDERALVRRSALQIIKNAVLINDKLLNEIIPLVCGHCRDPAMTVRRFAVSILTILLQTFPDHPNFQKEWVKAVIPQIFDIEVKVQEKVLESCEELILDKIINDSNDLVPWKLIDTLTTMKMRKHLVKACEAWVHAEIISDNCINKIQSRLNSDDNIPAWVLLSAIAENKTLERMESHFTDYKNLLRGTSFLEFLSLEVLRSCWSTFDDLNLKKLSSDFFQCLTAFDVHSESISIALDILQAVLNHHNHETVPKMSELMDKSCKIIERIIEEDSPADVETYCRAICTLGHASCLCHKKVDLKVLRILQGMLIDWETMPGSIKKSKELQAATVVILGQQAMREQTIAHEMMPIFGKLLCCADSDSAVRVNAAKALADVCTRFTTLVEPYLPDMCISMKDPNSTVREAIVVIFIQLFVEDFIKVKESFFFHILTMLSDPDETIREMTIFLIKERLLVKNKTLISQQFLDGIFHYNDFEFPKKYVERKMRLNERTALTLPGKINENKRKMIYDFMLEHLDPPGKLKLLVKITSQVFNAFLAGIIKFNDEKALCVLKDSLYIVANDHLQPSGCSKVNEDDNEDAPTQNNAVNVIAEGIKKHGLHTLLPTLLKLKGKMIGNASLLDDVTKVFARISSDFNKEQLSVLYDEFPEVKHDLEYNIR